jgi:predicted nuclease with TOPRIM domain
MSEEYEKIIADLEKENERLEGKKDDLDDEVSRLKDKVSELEDLIDAGRDCFNDIQRECDVLLKALKKGAK